MEAILDKLIEFCNKEKRLESVVPISQLQRLSSLCADTTGQLNWSVKGSINKREQLQLDLAVKGTLLLECQRCLDVFPFDLNSQVSLLLAKTEEEANDIEDELDPDDETEVIVGTDRVDLLVLVEDEVLLTIPLSPKHDQCPKSNQLTFGAEKTSPFAVLQQLKVKK